MINTLIFDLDGVIVDTAQFHYKAWNKLAKQWGQSISHEQNEMLKGINRIKSLEMIAAWCNINLSEDEKQHFATVKNDWYLDYVNKMTSDDVLPGVKELIEEARAAQMLVAVASASKNAIVVLKHVNLFHLFHFIADGNMVKESKPNPAVFLRVTHELKVEPCDCIVFEDAPAGVEAAIAGGFNVIGIGDEVTLANAHSVVQSFTHLSLPQIVNTVFQN